MSFQLVGGIDEDGDPDMVYFNATIIRNTSSATVTPDPPARFQETRQVPIIHDASKYNFSIIRANLNGPGRALPLFIPMIRKGAENPTQNVNLTTYSVTLRIVFNYTIGGNPFTFTASSTRPVIWTPEITDTTIAPVPLPISTTTEQDLRSAYYYCFTVQHWLRLVNIAIENARNDINTLFQANYTAPAGWNQPGPAPTIQTLPPLITYNPTNNLFSGYFPRNAFGGANRTSAGTLTDENATLWFNENLWGMFGSFPAFRVAVPTIAGIPRPEANYEFDVYPILFSNIQNVGAPPAPTARSYWVMTQDYATTSSLWSPVESLVFTSTMLPLAFEQTGNPVRLGQNVIGQTGNLESAFTPIITDISLTNESAADYKGFIQFVPSAEYRMASFQRSKSEISNVDIQVFWKNRLDGNLYPVYMPQGSSISVKCLFRRRGVYDYPHPAKGF